MSKLLLDAVISFVRSEFTRQEVATVEAYGGQFNSAEMDQLSYSCPAILVTVLGWTPEHDSSRLTGKGVRKVRLAAFVAAKHVEREKRLGLAMSLAERLAIKLRQWVPSNEDQPLTIAPLEEEPNADNLFSRAIDSKGQALWLVDWTQCVKPQVGLDELGDLLIVDITDHTRAGQVPTAPKPNVAPLQVTEDVQFVPSP
ncbi:MAG: hypothetical protein K2W93_19035 [Burkholderiaceae bacterium]|nr:hypothetical protein [Burkholderiaceae bacterium]